MLLVSSTTGNAVGVKKQQMRWTPRGAHHLLLVRVQTLNDDLRIAFRRWYPDFGRRRQERQAARHTPKNDVLLRVDGLRDSAVLTCCASRTVRSASHGCSDVQRRC
jgi:hypothetical protein